MVLAKDSTINKNPSGSSSTFVSNGLVGCKSVEILELYINIPKKASASSF
jgi:hypothetical protein